jgi:hypothetical protein
MSRARNLADLLDSSGDVKSSALDNATTYTHPNHSGDVTSSGDGATTIANDAVVSAKIADDAVTLAKMADMATASILGRNTASTGDPEVLSATTARTLLNVADGSNNYTHPSGDGNLHVPATSTSNDGKFLKAGSTAGSLSWDAVDALPSQSGNNGKYLGTDGNTATWNTLDTDANTTTKGLYEMAHTISSNYSITSTANAMSAGPITINASITVTVPATSTWVIV